MALQGVLGDAGAVICHRAIAGELARRDLAIRGVALHEPVLLDWLSADVAVTAVPAADGWGLRRVSWVVDGAGRRVIHCGDTLWHGHWWDIARQYGPFDLAFLPINGVVYHRGRYTGSPIPATLTPQQAAVVGQLLGARVVCPIHYGRADDPAHYAEAPDVEAAFLDEARRRGVGTLVLAAGAWVEWDGVAGARA